MPAVPNTTTFSLQDVVDIVQPAENSLAGCFNNAIESKFDPLYSGNKNELLNFRNYNNIVTLHQCNTANIYYNVFNTGVIVGDVLQFQIGTPPSGPIYCGTVIELGVLGTEDATILSNIIYNCGDGENCAQ